MSGIKAPSIEDMKAGFTFARFTSIKGMPSYETITKLETEMIRDAATIECRVPHPHVNLCGAVEQPADYNLRIGTPFTIAPYPGDMPVYPDDASEDEKKNIKNYYNLNLRLHTTTNRMESVFQSMMENAINNTYLAGIHTAKHGFGTMKCVDIVAWLYATYGRITPQQLEENTKRLTTPVANDQPIAVIFQQIEDCQKLAAAGGTPFTAAQIIKAAETLVLHTGKYTQSYREWLTLEAAQKTYNNFKVCFAQEYQVQNELFPTTQDAGFHDANNAEGIDNGINEITDAVTNFANAAATDRDTFNTLTTTNAQLQQQIAMLAEQNNMLQEMMCLTMSNTNNNNNNYNPTQPPAPPPPTNPYQPRMPFTPTQFSRGRGRGGGRGRGRQGRVSAGRGRGRTQPPPSRQQPQPWEYSGYQYPAQQQNPPGQRQPSRFKRHNNWNYCWSCGFDVEDWHTSSTCPTPMMNHNVNAARANTFGGSRKGHYRTSLPQQQTPYDFQSS